MAGATGLILGTAPVPVSAAPLTAIGTYQASQPAAFPTDALGGERDALSSDGLLLTDPGNGGLTFQRTANDTMSGLITPPHGDEPESTVVGLNRVNPVAATGAGSLTAPFVQRTVSASMVQGPMEDKGPILQVTSPSDRSEFDNGYTTLGGMDAAPHAGDTYLLRTGVTLPSVDSAPAALTNTNVSGEGTVVAPALTSPAQMGQQWTVADRGKGVDGTDQYNLVNRADGTCLGFDASASTWGGVVCDPASADQLWESRALPASSGGGSGIYNVGWSATSGHDTWLTYHSVGQPVGYLRVIPLSLLHGSGGATVGASWQWQQVEQPTPIPGSMSFRAENRPDFPYDLTVGDLSGLKDAHGAPRDQAAVVYGADGKLVISVIDWTGPSVGTPTVTTLRTSIALGAASTGGAYGPVSVNTANFTGGLGSDIVVSYTNASGAAQAVAARYSRTGAKGAIVLLGNPVPLDFSSSVGSAGAVYSADVTIGDFAGDGTQELAWVGGDPNGGGVPLIWITQLSLTGGALSAQWKGAVQVHDSPLRTGPAANAFVRVASGRFQPQLAGTGTRQVAVTWADDTGTWAQIYTVSDHGAKIRGLSGGAMSLPTLAAGATSGLSMAVGGFAEAGGGNDTNWGIAVSRVGSGAGSQGPQVVLIQPQGSGVVPAVTALKVTPTSYTGIDVSGYDLTSWDALGNSLVLGSPIVFTVQNLNTLNLVAGQPPTHSDWLNGGFVNVSRNQDFSLTMGDSTTQGFQNGTSQESNQATGLTGNGDLTLTVKEGVPLFEKAKVSGGISAELNKSWSTMNAQTDSANSSATQTVTQSTVDDDIVDATVQDYAVYRYPVLSSQSWNNPALSASGCGGSCYTYWDVVIPGTPYRVSGPGKAYGTLFQPSWQNGNALSYPQLSNGLVDIDDLGSYSYVDSAGVKKVVHQPLLNQNIQLGGTSTHVGLDVSQATDGATTETSQQSWSHDDEVNAGVSLTAKIPLIGKTTMDASGSVGYNPSSAFINTTTGSTTNSHAGSFTLAVPTVPAEPYDFATAYYYDSNGTPTVANGVDLTGNSAGAPWWKATYDTGPDPALNLPNATILGFNKQSYQDVVEWNPNVNAQELRGFSAHRPADPGNAAISSAVYASAPAPGDPVVFDVEVSNYSLVPLGTTPLTVDFSAVPVSADGLTVEGAPVPIGRSTVTSLPPQGHVTVSSPTWAARGSKDGGAQNWRIFVILNRGHTITNELHGWAGDGTDTCPESSIEQQGGAPVSSLTDPMTGKPSTLVCGQNDQGYGTLSVIPTATGTSEAQAAGVRLSGGGVVTRNVKTLNLTSRSPVPTVTTREASTVLVRAHADHNSSAYQTVIVYDGPPKDGKMVAVTQLQGVVKGDTSTAAFTYTPTTDGVHELYAEVLGSPTTGGNHGIILRVDSTGTRGGSAGNGGNGHSNGGSGAHNGSGHGNNGSAAQPPAAGTPQGAAVNTGGVAEPSGDALPWMLVGLGAFVLLGSAAILRRRRRREEHDDAGE